MKRWMISAIAVLSVSCTIGATQDTMPSSISHQHSQPEMIDGMIHPEFIPDLVAYRLYLMAVSRSSTPTQAEIKSQADLLRVAHLKDQDKQALISILANFRERYLKLIHNFNEQAAEAEARGQIIDPSTMFRERDALVQSTHDTVRSVLSPAGWINLDAHVQNEKRMMKIPATEGLK